MTTLDEEERVRLVAAYLADVLQCGEALGDKELNLDYWVVLAITRGSQTTYPEWYMALAKAQEEEEPVRWKLMMERARHLLGLIRGERDA